MGNRLNRSLGAAIADSSENVGCFLIERPDGDSTTVDAYSSIIEDDDGNPVFRLAALVVVRASPEGANGDLERQLRDKDTALKEIEHRVRNNLQMITALIRLEARTTRVGATKTSSTKSPAASRLFNCSTAH